MTQEPPATAGFSATQAASSGFGLMMRHRGAVIAWSLWMLLLVVVGTAVAGGLVVLAAAGDLQALIDADTFEAIDPSIMVRMVAIAVPAFLALFLATWAASAIIMASATRLVLDPAAPAEPYLRFGADEWRVFLVSVVYGLVYIGGILFIVLGGIGLWQLGWWAGLLFGIASTCLLIYLSVRLSLAVPLTMALRRFELLGSWPLTRGRFWPILGAYVLAWLFLVVASIAAGMVGQVAAFGAFAGIGLGGEPGVAAIAVAVISLLIYLASQMLYTVVQTVVLAATPASIYREVGGSWQAEVF